MTRNCLGPARLCHSARSTTDIRHQHRESLKTQRYNSRFDHMLKKRGLQVHESDEDKSETYSDTEQYHRELTREAVNHAPQHFDPWYLANDTYEDLTESSSGNGEGLQLNSSFDSEHEASEISESYDELDFSCDTWDPSSWFSGAQQRPCNTPPPSLSIGSESSYGSPRRNRLPLTRHESLVLRKRVTETCKDHEQVRFKFEELKSLINLNSSKPELLIPTLFSKWRVISDAILHQDSELVHNALNLANDLVSSHWIKTEDLLFILQQGFLLTLKESLVRSGNHQVWVIKLILAIIRHGPSATPYIVQILSNCGLLETFSELFLMGSFEDTQMVAQFYSQVFQILCGLAASDEFAPTVPTSIAASDSTRKLAKLYDPLQTLKQIVRPNLTAPIINWLFKQIGFIECETFRSSLAFVANSIRYVSFYLQNISSDAEWARSMAQTFQYGHIETLITTSIESGSVDQYPKSVRVELEQFREFYRCWSDEMSHYLRIC